jgi:hypothetical protein
MESEEGFNYDGKPVEDYEKTFEAAKFYLEEAE